ncbi:hypothetical protein ACIA5C_06790 [Actinoplanes sp. NPDC051343]|uniref:hypothetical protein n=1 Tax=Actinoplanes sp. NPDC051343 TaxID=3363906 RepID=UPI0037B11FD7
MSDGEFHAYIGLLALSGVVLAVMAARGFGQARTARVVDALFAAGFLGYASYLILADPATVTVFFYAFAVPVLAVVNAIRSRRQRRGEPVPAPMTYAGPPAGGFPPPPDFAQQPAAGFPPAPAFPPATPPSALAFAPAAPPSAPAFAPAAPPSAPAFAPAAPLFAPPATPARTEAPTADPGSYPSMPSGLAGHESDGPAMRSGRPSGLPAATQQTFPTAPAPAAPAAPGGRPSGLPRRVHTEAEPPAHPEFTQHLELPPPDRAPDQPAGPQPMYPAHPGTPPTPGWRSDPAQQFPAAPEHRNPQPAPELADERYVHAPADYFEQVQAGHAAQHPAPSEQPAGRHSYPDQPTAGRHWQADPEPFTQPTYRPAHGEPDPHPAG